MTNNESENADTPDERMAQRINDAREYATRHQLEW